MKEFKMNKSEAQSILLKLISALMNEATKCDYSCMNPKRFMDLRNISSFIGFLPNVNTNDLTFVINDVMRYSGDVMFNLEECRFNYLI